MPRKIKKTTIDKRLHAVRHMPPLYHTLPGQEYARDKSLVLQWLGQDVGLLDYVFQFLHRKNLVVYNQQTGQWQGADYDTTED